MLHGDVDIIPAGSIPKNYKSVPFTGGEYVLRHGESGHRHVIVAERPEMIEIFLDPVSGLHALRVKEAVTITHEEHRNLVIEPGIYKEAKENEYSPFERQLKSVRD